MKKVALLVDFGNSETRVRIKSKGDDTFPEVNKTISLSNHFAVLAGDYAVSEDYMDRTTTIFSLNGARIANGKLVDHEFKKGYLSPTGTTKGSKVAQDVTFWSARLVILKALWELSEAWKTPISSLDVVFDFYGLLPPEEQSDSNELFQKNIREITSIDELVPFQNDTRKSYVTQTYTISFDRVESYPEGVTAFMGAVFEVSPEGTLQNVAKNERYQTGCILVIDVGAGTTDFAIMEDCQLIENSKRSVNRAGTNILRTLELDIRKQFNKVPLRNVASVITEGRLREGAIDADISVLLTKAKKEFGRQMALEIQEYFESQNTEASEIKGILVIGGGAVAARDANGNVISPAVSELIISELKNVTPYAELLTYDGKNPRLLNLEGLDILYTYA